MPKGKWWGTEDEAEKNRAWNWGIARSTARWRANRPTHQVSRVRRVLDRIGMTLVAFEFEFASEERLFFVDIVAGFPDGSLVYIDGTWDSGQPLKPKNRDHQQAKAAHLAALGLPYLFVDSRDSAEIELTLRKWLRSVNPSWAPGRPRPSSVDEADLRHPSVEVASSDRRPLRRT